MSKSRGGTLLRRSRRHRLLFQQRLAEMVFWPGLLIVVLCIALLLWAPPALAAGRPRLIVAAMAAGVIALFSQWLSLRAYVHCRADGLRLHLPLRRWTIPYDQIQSTRLVELTRQFPPENEPWSRRRFLEPFAGTTAVVVELDRLPATRSRLRLWMSPYMLSPQIPGLLLPVRDWLTFRGELDEFRARSYHERT